MTYGSVKLAWEPSDHLWTVRRDGGPAVVVDQASYTDEAPEPGREPIYQVSVYTGRADAPAASVTVKTPAEPTPGLVPPAPDVFFSEIKPAKATTRWGKVTTDRSVGGKPLTIGGKTFARGLGTHAPAATLRAVALLQSISRRSVPHWRGPASPGRCGCRCRTPVSGGRKNISSSGLFEFDQTEAGDPADRPQSQFPSPPSGLVPGGGFFCRGTACMAAGCHYTPRTPHS